MDRPTADSFDPRVLDLFDRYVHGAIDRREFVARAARYVAGAAAAATVFDALAPNYALAQQVAPDDPRIHCERVEVDAPQGHGKVRALLARPSASDDAPKLPGVVVVHENRGLNPYIEDVARRLAVAGYLALAPDGLTSVGGYPGTDDEGRALQSKLDPQQLVADFAAGVRYLLASPGCTGKVGVVGFCFGGMVSNALAVSIPELAAAVPFYGRAPELDAVPGIKARLCLHFAETDPRVNAAWPPYEAALKAAGVRYEAFTYPGTQHGFHNDTTPRYDAAAAKLAWERTLKVFEGALR